MNSLCCNSNDVKSVDIPQDCGQETHDRLSNDAHKHHIFESPNKFIVKIKNYVIRKYNERIDRQAFNYLLTLDESLLKDIGVTRGDVQWASQLPLCEDAGIKIEEIARRR